VIHWCLLEIIVYEENITRNSLNGHDKVRENVETLVFRIIRQFPQQFVKLSENIQKTPSGWNLVVPGRILIKDGVLEHSGHDVNVWLFTDLLLLTRKVEQEKKKGKKSKKDEPDKFQYINKVELKNAQACEYPDNPTYKNAFSVAQGTHSILLQACSVDEMKEWIEDISKAVAAVKK